MTSTGPVFIPSSGGYSNNSGAITTTYFWLHGCPVYTGLLHTGSIDTRFSIKDAENNNLGRVDRSGLYLKNNGTAGILQKIDLAI